MPAIALALRAKMVQQQTEMLADQGCWCPFEDDVLALAWRRAEDLDLDDANALRCELLDTERMIELGRLASNTTAVSIDDLLRNRGYTRQQIKQLDDDGLLAVKWDKPATRRKGYVLRAELDALPGRLRAHTEEQALQRKLRNDYVAGRTSKPADGDLDGELPDCLR